MELKFNWEGLYPSQMPSLPVTEMFYINVNKEDSNTSYMERLIKDNSDKFYIIKYREHSYINNAPIYNGKFVYNIKEIKGQELKSLVNARLESITRYIEDKRNKESSLYSMYKDEIKDLETYIKTII